MAYLLKRDRLDEFLQGLCQNRSVFALEQAEEQFHLVSAEKWEPGKHALGSFRPVEPLKSVVFRPREQVGALGGDGAVPPVSERVLIGVKNCDLSALAIHDHVFLDTEPVDPFYAELRKNTIIVSCDCTDARDVCFCPMVNEQPYAKEGFDINLSACSEGYVAESGSERGEKLLKELESCLAPAEESALKNRDESRAEMTERVRGLAARKGLTSGSDYRQAIQKAAEAPLWGEFAQDCVECGACNFICCTCHCFLLADGTSKDNEPTRVKQWDSCLYRNFARVAGGANPRGHRADRLFNRFDKKFNFFPEVLGRYACDGCGRCIEACTGKIDIRDVLKRALDES